jgi:hypothetical protein
MIYSRLIRNGTGERDLVYVVYDEGAEVSPEAWAKLAGGSVNPGDGPEELK